jgi:hypothetical protein
MNQPSPLEQRVNILEREVAALKQQLGNGPHPANWIEKITGTFEGDEEFAEIIGLGAEIRRADRFTEDDR